MTVLLAVLVVGAGSLAFRLGPLLGADRIPDAVTRVAGWAGLSMLAAVVVRTVVRHDDPVTSVAPLLGAAAVAVCLLLTASGRSLLLAVGAGGTTYLALTTLVRLV
jgi:branched-subunit amino acid transport protein